MKPANFLQPERAFLNAGCAFEFSSFKAFSGGEVVIFTQTYRFVRAEELAGKRCERGTFAA